MDELLGTPTMIREARATGKGHHWIVELLIAILVCVVLESVEVLSQMIGVLFYSIYFAKGTESDITRQLMELTTNRPTWVKLFLLVSTGLLTIGVILYCRWIEKRKTPTLGFRRGHMLREYLVGAAVAFAMISVAVGIGLLTGAYRLSVSGVSVGVLLAYLVGYMIQGMSEEALCRGYLMVSIARKNALWLAVLLSSLVFSALHWGNPGFTLLAFANITLFGLLMAVYVLKRGNIWGACALHSFWNFFQGNLYGISVSGTGDGDSIFTATQCGPTVLNGGLFGIEGGLLTTVVLVAALLIVLFALPKQEAEENRNAVSKDLGG